MLLISKCFVQTALTILHLFANAAADISIMRITVGKMVWNYVKGVEMNIIHAVKAAEGGFPLTLLMTAR